MAFGHHVLLLAKSGLDMDKMLGEAYARKDVAHNYLLMIILINIDSESPHIACHSMVWLSE